MDATVLIVNVVILSTVLESDLFTRRITIFRVLRPVLVAGIVIPLFVTDIVRTGTGLAFELASIVAGVALGLLVCRALPTWWSPTKMAAVSRGGIAYAALWCSVVGLRLAFAYQTEHAWRVPFFTWLVQHHIPLAAYADGMIFLAFAMTLTRTAHLAVQRRRVYQPTVQVSGSSQSASVGSR